MAEEKNQNEDMHIAIFDGKTIRRKLIGDIENCAGYSPFCTQFSNG